MRQYLRLLKFLKPYQKLVALAFVLMLFSSLFDGISLSMIVPLADKVLTNRKIIIPAKLPPFLEQFIQHINNLSPLLLLNIMAVVILFLFLLKGIFSFLQGYIMSDIGQRIVRDVRMKLYAKIQELSLDYFTRTRGGEMVSRILNDPGLLENALSYALTDLIYEGSKVILFTFLVFFIHFRLALVSLIILPLVTFPVVKVGKRLRKLSYLRQEKSADINTLVFETILGARIVKAFCREDYEIERFNKHIYNFYKITMKSIKRVLLLSPFTEFIGVLAAVFIFVWAGKEVISGRMSFGVFGLFLGALLSLIRPFKKLSQTNALFQQALAASHRIYELLERQPTILESPQAVELPRIKKEIVFERVWFSYNHVEVLKDINLRVKAGEVVAIVGISGTGKSTLLDLILRFYDPQKGRILIDGYDIRNVKLSSLRQQIGIVTQETILFNDTVWANIAYGKFNATQREIEEAAFKANALDFIKKLPLGFDTIIGERGTSLSGGERQRIAIARAILKDPPILLLDEATSQLDSESERIVQEAIERLMVDRTVIVVAHRLSTIKNSNRIVVLDKGRVIEEGTHEQLIQRDGLYRKLYLVQEVLR
ncbi:MAG: ABC transporter ATP-binding protein/permease [Candidatus Omnitrophica bacterium]|nr:ABC transporter ATP-binding protein/permease [Candidatus Omnitrophota bacterium]